MAYTTIDDPTIHFNTKIYTGNGSSGHAITGVGFQPDWVWIKNRGGTGDHALHDVIRGATKRLKSNNTNAEATASEGVHSNGSITSSVSVNTTAGFSIVSYAGYGSNSTVGHGLGSAPKLIIIKNRSQSNGWIVGHEELDTSNPWHKYVELHSTNGVADLNTIWNDTAPTSSVFTLGTEAAVNNSSNNFIAYCFTEKQGYSKFGKYTGNGNADGAFSFCGFRPAWIMVKPIDATQNWQIHDTKRPGYNVKNYNLSSNSTAAEADNEFMDILSNGFKIRRSDVLNVSGDKYIFWAFAEQPFVNSSGIPCNAR